MERKGTTSVPVTVRQVSDIDFFQRVEAEAAQWAAGRAAAVDADQLALTIDPREIGRASCRERV